MFRDQQKMPPVKTGGFFCGFQRKKEDPERIKPLDTKPPEMTLQRRISLDK